MQSLSVVLATFNEEENIGKCLNSIRDIAQEIVVVDGTSSDRTVEIAKRYGAKVYITENKQNFHINKQMAIDNATKSWILQLDADEVVSKSLQSEIEQKIQIKNNEIHGYWMPRKNWFLGKFLTKGGQYPDYTLRLYRKGSGRLPQKDVHEQAVVEGETEYLTHPLLHYPYKDFKHYFQKWIRYVDLTSSQIRVQKDFFTIKKFISYLFVLPMYWFFLIYLRHKGFVDLWPGFLFAFFSALRYPTSYLRALFLNEKK
ncbi:MAG: glycosyltransferase family 2 protein [Candidatus Levybacteria bacterium]|nr:glycosyltransferase family 2 protein [Candidatus Levybacteria bacterium]